MHRRLFLARTLAGIGALAASPKVFAQAGPDPRSRRLLEIARHELARAGSLIGQRDLVGIADFGLHSSRPRFHFVDLVGARVESVLVTHGNGSDPEHDGWLNGFSNLPDSLASSRGAYGTQEQYHGRHGASLRLGGLEADNSNALPRAIVIHAAAYATSAHVERWGRLGRSNGCFAFAPDLLPRALAQLGGGRLLFADRLGIGPDGTKVAMPPQKPVDFAALARANARARA